MCNLTPENEKILLNIKKEIEEAIKDMKYDFSKEPDMASYQNELHEMIQRRTDRRVCIDIEIK